MKSRNGRAMADGGSATAVGEVVEWLMAPVLKTGEAKASVGSNPTLSVACQRASWGHRKARLTAGRHA